jgi:CheY-like chemotaxis protein
LSSDGDGAVLVVSDTGQGIDTSFLPHVFEMFRQADGSNRRRHGGLGIGLALVRQLVQLHGGTIKAESDGPNKGSRFIIRLPLLRETASLIGSSVMTAGAVELGVFAQKSFLVVDDSEDTIAMLTELLRVAGANVTTATNGADALRAAEENEFDVILSDISMPEMDGFEFLAELRQREDGRSVPVVVLTAKDLTAEDRKRLNGSVEKVLRKGSLSHAQLLAEVGALMAGALRAGRRKEEPDGPA